ncbi:hypothetical protein Tcan_16219 [Toxocara canis]|uniref:F-box domain-containing protein n=1 Tax=Toxocara canis TaxID=6265 RepID=A0A0B2V2Q1_TOXCA|nr:hypothetical protein Tcan_16219 [Toxocara canis]
MVKLDELPLTVLMKIFECVPDPNDVCNLSEVCRLFDQLITDHPHKLSKFAVDKFDVHVRYTWNGLVRVSLIAFRNDGKGHHRVRLKSIIGGRIASAELLGRCTRSMALNDCASVNLTISNAKFPSSDLDALFKAFVSSVRSHRSLPSPTRLQLVDCNFERCDPNMIINLHNTFICNGTRAIDYLFCDYGLSAIKAIFASNIHYLKEMSFIADDLKESPTVFIDHFVSAMTRPDRICKAKFCCSPICHCTAPRLVVLISIESSISDSGVRSLMERAYGRAKLEMDPLWLRHAYKYWPTVSLTPYARGRIPTVRLVADVKSSLEGLL